MAGNTKHETDSKCTNIVLVYKCRVLKVSVSCCFSDDDSELSDNDKEPLPKGEQGLLNGGTDGMIVNGSLSRDGEFHLPSVFLCKLYSESCQCLFMYAC